MALTATPAPDRDAAIGELLQFVQMDGVFYCPSFLTEPWGLALPAMGDCIWFHAVSRGTCTLEVGGDRWTMKPGDLVLVPHGAGHRAWGAAEAPTPMVFDLPHDEISDDFAILRHGGGGDQTEIVCGGIRFDHPAARQLAAALPSVVHIESSQLSRSDWLPATLGLMAEETQRVRAGSEAVISRLCDIVVIQALRMWIEHDPGARTGWLGALRDPQIGRAITLIHQHPERDWTVASLADAVAMSRSAFAARFTDLVGESAMRYVTGWRMQVAHDLLASGAHTVAAVAAQVGYDSDASFSRAFKRVTGVSPRDARRSAGA